MTQSTVSFRDTIQPSNNGHSRVALAAVQSQALETARMDPYKDFFEKVSDFKQKLPADLPRPEQCRQTEAAAADLLIQYNKQALARQWPLLEDGAVQRALDEIFGMGPIEPLMRDESIEDVFVLGPSRVMSVGALGVRHHPDIGFESELALQALVNKWIAHEGKTLTPATPALDGRVANKSRLHAVMSPIAEPSPSVTIRKRRLVARRFQDLLELGTLTPSAAQFMRLMVQVRASVLVAGGTGAGKTNFLNALGTLLDPTERVIAIEDTRELELPIPNVVYLTTRLSSEKTSEITQRDLVKQALRMRPDRLVMGEARDGAAADMIEATNTGHAGSWASVHAESATEALRRVESLYQQGDGKEKLPIEVVREGVAKAFQIVVFVRRIHNTTLRRVTEILHVTGKLERLPGGGAVIAREHIFQSDSPQQPLQFKSRPSEPLLSLMRERLSSQEIEEVFRPHGRT
jgi:Flp pilus assembly CpaF family ATPase